MPAPIKTVSDFKVAGSSSAFPESDAHVVALANGQFDVAWTQDCTSIDPVDMDVRPHENLRSEAERRGLL